MRAWPMEYQNWGRRGRGYERTDKGQSSPRRRDIISFRPDPWTRLEGKSEATLRIASVHFELSTLSGPATDQLKLPSGAPDARHRQWG